MNFQQAETFADVIRRAYPPEAIKHMEALANAGVMAPFFQNALTRLATNSEELQAAVRAAEVQSRWTSPQVTEAMVAVETVSRALQALPVEKMNQLASVMAEIAKPLLAEQSDANVDGGGQSKTIPVSFSVDVKRTVVRSVQLNLDVKIVIGNSTLESSVADEIKEWLVHTGEGVYDALRVRLPLLVPVFVAWANNLKAEGCIDEYNAVMFLVIFSIVLINPQGK